MPSLDHVYADHKFSNLKIQNLFQKTQIPSRAFEMF